MDSWFDKLAKDAAHGGGLSRRNALKGLAAGLGGTILAVTLPGRVDAGCFGTGHPCRDGGDCCSGNCVDHRCTPPPPCGGFHTHCTTNADCCVGLHCANGKCVGP